MNEPTQTLDIPGPGSVQNGTRPEEQQTFEEGMVQHMQQRRRQSECCCSIKVIGPERESEAEAGKYNSDVFDCAVS
jgi:hypothetical protein